MHPNLKEVKLSLFAGDVILYIETPKDFTKRLLELMQELSKDEGYKINIWVLVSLLKKHLKENLRK